MIDLARQHAHGSMARGQHAAAAGSYRRILDADPYDESAHRGLIEAYRAVGAHGQADAAHDRYRAAMAELGLHPPADLAQP